ncbi:MAG: C-terminal binding protein [Lachnospiraceae bacterium]|nr:C-terminal binding protein [Lachnospiraceae bacterium]
MSKFKIVISDYYYATQDEENAVYQKLGGDCEIVDLTHVKPGGIMEPEELIPYVTDCDALVVQFAKVTAEVIAAMTKCKVVARYAIGVDNIDVTAATEKGIYVANVPDYCIDEVANTAAAHLLNAMRKIGVARDQLLNGSFDINAIQPIKRLKEATLCLLGFGNIARDLYKKMRPFFKEIVAYDPYFNAKDSYPDVRFLPLEEAVACADAISIHVPLNDSTRGLVNAEVLAHAKDGVVIVNTARGGLIDDTALLAALDSGKVAHAGLDVIADENFADSPYLHHPAVTLTPHFSWCSTEAGLELQRKTAENVVAVLLNGAPVCAVNMKSIH